MQWHSWGESTKHNSSFSFLKHYFIYINLSYKILFKTQDEETSNTLIKANVYHKSQSLTQTKVWFFNKWTTIRVLTKEVTVLRIHDNHRSIEHSHALEAYRYMYTP